MRILLIEDDPLIGDGLKVGLEQLHYSVDWFEEGKLGYQALASAPYDVVILDLTLPKMDGIEILSEWRKQGLDTPVLILTARGSVDDKVLGLRQGADDYLAKPFSLSELVARLEALIRRRYQHTQSIIIHNNITLDLNAREIYQDGNLIHLTSKEFKVISLLLMNADRVLTRQFIEEKIHNWDEDVSSNALEVHIYNLRKKLGNALIQTVHGVGYRLGKNNA